MEVTAKKSLAQPHNCYNIFFILERQKLIQAMKGSSDGDGTPARALSENGTDSLVDLGGYGSLKLPELPQRYKDLSLENRWYVPGKNAKRKHVKTHGLASFADMARTVASNWKVVDSETEKYCHTVARIIKDRYTTLLKAGWIGSTTKRGPKKKSQTISKKKKSPKIAMNRRQHPLLPHNLAMADIPNRGNLHRSSSTESIIPSASIANNGIVSSDTFYNYFVTLTSTYDNMGFATRHETQLLPGTSAKADANSEHSRNLGSGNLSRRASDPMPLEHQFLMNNMNFEPNQAPYNGESNTQESCESSSNSKRMTCSNLAIFEDTGASDLAAGSESPKVCSGIGAKKSGGIFLDESRRSSAPMEHEIASFCQETGTSLCQSDFGDCSRGRSNRYLPRRASNPMPLDYQISAPAPLNPENNPQENGGSSSNSKRTSCSDLSTFYEESGGSSSNSKRMSSSDLSMFYDMAFSRMSAQIGLEMASQPNPKQRRMRLDSNITPRLDEFLGQEWMNRPIEKSNLAMESEFPNDPVTTTMGELDIDCSPIPHRNAPNNHSNKTSQEVDICDSVIRDMASGMW
eukprot:CAMPEP_0181129878 /NCGR_PEP_ID=MMETSP1071-20121207/29560_1 /TAXON_ID=35127 /ORGANISM="Thalassiosira sp., Strain NH16" /LENGTH=573 /DNA_ID=CAMNT_0023215901 /DNA_START=98 /DNA_END=1819 /DNA_ORIENTATION=-